MTIAAPCRRRRWPQPAPSIPPHSRCIGAGALLELIGHGLQLGCELGGLLGQLALQGDGDVPILGIRRLSSMTVGPRHLDGRREAWELVAGTAQVGRGRAVHVRRLQASDWHEQPINECLAGGEVVWRLGPRIRRCTVGATPQGACGPLDRCQTAKTAEAVPRERHTVVAGGQPCQQAALPPLPLTRARKCRHPLQ